MGASNRHPRESRNEQGPKNPPPDASYRHYHAQPPRNAASMTNASSPLTLPSPREGRGNLSGSTIDSGRAAFGDSRREFRFEKMSAGAGRDFAEMKFRSLNIRTAAIETPLGVACL